MGTLQTFYQRVSRGIRRGKVYDGDIPGAAEDAVKELEDLENWLPMWQDAESLVTASLTASLERVKTIKYIRTQLTSGKYFYLRKASPHEVSGQQATGVNPEGYWMNSRSSFTFTGVPTSPVTYEIGYYQYSEVNDDLWMLDECEDLLIAQTILQMQPILRDDKLLQRWGSIAARRLVALQESDLVHEFDGQHNTLLPFAAEVEEYLAETGNDT